MLKITRVVLARQEITLQLDGRLTGQWVELLRENAESVLNDGLSLNVDLKNICFIDCKGIALIMSLINRGVLHVNAPLFVVEQIRRCKDVQDA
jgi:ABC-type transporter Mla MlaB component